MTRPLIITTHRSETVHIFSRQKGAVLRVSALADSVQHNGRYTITEMPIGEREAIAIMGQLAEVLGLEMTLVPLQENVSRALGLATPETVLSPRPRGRVLDESGMFATGRG